MPQYTREELYRRLELACEGKTDMTGGLNVINLKRAVAEFSGYFGSLLPSPGELNGMLRNNVIALIVKSGILHNKELQATLGSAAAPAPKSAKVQSSAPAPDKPMVKLLASGAASGAAAPAPTSVKVLAPDKPIVKLAKPFPGIGHSISGAASGAASTSGATLGSKFPKARLPAVRAPPVPIDGAGQARGQIKALAVKLNEVVPKYEHVLVETGGGGHCGYYCFAAGLNVINRMRGIPLGVTYTDLRKVLAKTILTVHDDKIVAMHQTEYGAAPATVAEGRYKLYHDTLMSRWATEYDLSQLGKIYSIGVILFNMKTGELYNMSTKYNGFTHYMIIANNPRAHYQNIGLRLVGSDAPYAYAYACVDLPEPIRVIINEEATAHHDIQKFQCDIEDFVPVIIGAFSNTENARDFSLTEDGIEYLDGILNTLHHNISSLAWGDIPRYIPGELGQRVLSQALLNRDVVNVLSSEMSGIIIHVCREILSLTVREARRERCISPGLLSAAMNEHKDFKYINYGISIEEEFPVQKPRAPPRPVAPVASASTSAASTVVSASDPFNLQRFVVAQDKVYSKVIAELTAGKKKTHWIWYIFPQHAKIRIAAAPSLNSRTYGITEIDEAKAYIAHPILGARLMACVNLVLKSQSSLHDIFGNDEAKFYSSISLFSMATHGQDNLVQVALKRYWNGELDSRTLEAIVA